MLQRADSSGSGVPGVDRVLWVRVSLRNGVPSGGVVHGTRHRRPVDVRVPADVAERLLRSGVPTVTSHDG